MEEQLTQIRKWLDLTDQQFDILRVIMNLESKKEPTNAKNINRAYETYNPKGIQTSNLYTILKILKENNFIARKSPGHYTVSYRGIRDKLGEVKKIRMEEEKEFEKLYIRTREFLRDKILEPSETSVKYYDNRGLNELLTKSLLVSTTYYSTDRFPNIALSSSWPSKDLKKQYVGLLYERGVVKKELDIYYLSDLNIKRYYDYMLEFYKNKEFVLNECIKMVDELGDILETNDNIRVGLIDDIYVMDVHLPEQEEPVEYISHVYDSNSRTIGGIHIKSPEAASYVKQYFLKKFYSSKKLEGKNMRRTLNQVKKALKDV